MNRISHRFARLQEIHEKGFIAYIGGGDPTLAATVELAVAFDKLGVDVLEIGVPFSDPLADGLVNQLAAQRGLESGTTPANILEAIGRIRKSAQIPIVLYVYFNLLHKFGLARFIREAGHAGVDGLLVLDLPPEESENYETLMRDAGLSVIYLIAPTTPENRIEFADHARPLGSSTACNHGEGIPAVTIRSLYRLIALKMTTKIRAHSKLPIAVVFGISNPQQAAAVAGEAEAVVVGSAIVNQIGLLGHDSELVPKVVAFVAPMVAAVKQLQKSAKP